MTLITLKTAELNGKHIAYTDYTEFRVQVGKGSKGSYKTRYLFVGNFLQAVLYYRAINIGNGFKKRLVSWDLNKPVLARQIS